MFELRGYFIDILNNSGRVHRFKTCNKTLFYWLYAVQSFHLDQLLIKHQWMLYAANTHSQLQFCHITDVKSSMAPRSIHYIHKKEGVLGYIWKTHKHKGAQWSWIYLEKTHFLDRPSLLPDDCLPSARNWSNIWNKARIEADKLTIYSTDT